MRRVFHRQDNLNSADYGLIGVAVTSLTSHRESGFVGHAAPLHKGPVVWGGVQRGNAPSAVVRVLKGLWHSVLRANGCACLQVHRRSVRPFPQGVVVILTTALWFFCMGPAIGELFDVFG